MNVQLKIKTGSPGSKRKQAKADIRLILMALALAGVAAFLFIQVRLVQLAQFRPVVERQPAEEPDQAALLEAASQVKPNTESPFELVARARAKAGSRPAPSTPVFFTSI